MKHFTISGGLEGLQCNLHAFRRRDHFDAIASGGYSQIQGSVDGNHLPQAPDFTGTVLGTYSFQPDGRIPAGGELRLQFDNFFRSQTTDYRSLRMVWSAPHSCGLIQRSIFLSKGGEESDEPASGGGSGYNVLNTVIALNAPRTYASQSATSINGRSNARVAV